MAAVTKTSSLDRALKAPVPHHLPKHMWQLEPTAKRNSMVAFMEQYLPQENGGTATPPQAGVRSMTASGRLPPSLLTRRPSIDKAATDVDELAKTKACLVHLAGDFEKLDLPEAEAKDGIRGKFAITDDGSMFVLNKIPVVQCSATEALDLLWDCREATVLKIWKLMVSGCKVKMDML
uniref:Uncharacterized protein n=1 Tax=Chrysotila carterae TaxID=13221 RepID=A0A7S4BWR2_CHRCT